MLSPPAADPAFGRIWVIFGPKLKALGARASQPFEKKAVKLVGPLAALAALVVCSWLVLAEVALTGFCDPKRNYGFDVKFAPTTVIEVPPGLGPSGGWAAGALVKEGTLCGRDCTGAAASRKLIPRFARAQRRFDASVSPISEGTP